MYNGQIYVKTENFFRPLTIHVYNSEGIKCGILKYLIKVVEREVKKTAKNEPAEVIEQAAVQVDLVGKIGLYTASSTFNLTVVTISNPTFRKDKYANDFDFSV